MVSIEHGILIYYMQRKVKHNMSQLKKALEKKLQKQHMAIGFSDDDMYGLIEKSAARIKEKRRLAKEKAKMHRQS